MIIKKFTKTKIEKHSNVVKKDKIKFKKNRVYFADEVFEENKDKKVNLTDFDIDTYLRKTKFKEKSINEFPKELLAEYRNNHFNFRNNILQTSHDVDVVDKLNKLETLENLGYKNIGKNISDVFNNITKNIDKPDNPYIINNSSNDMIDRIMNMNVHQTDGHNGNIIQNDMWKYDKEKIQNGGVFFNNITPHDNNFDQYQQAINY
jgi:hypothetical protein